MLSEAERHAFLRDRLGMTQQEIDQADAEMLIEWLTVGLPRQAAAVGMTPWALHRMLCDIMDQQEARDA